MSDIRLISILPQQPVQGVTQPAQPSGISGQSGGVQVQLPVGSVLSGFIINRDPQGNPILRTDKGDVTFATKFFLKIGSEVVIRVESHAGHTQARILTVNGQPPEIAERQSAYAAERDVVIDPAARQQPPAVARPPAPATQARQAPEAAIIVSRPATGLTVTGIVTAPPPTGTPAAAPLPPGTEITLKLVSIAPRPDTPGQPAAPPAFSAPAYAAYGRATGTPPPQATPAAIPPPGADPASPATPVTQARQAVTGAPPAPAAPVTTVPAAPPAGVLPQAPVPPIVVQPGAQLHAIPVAREPGGETVVQTAAGVIRLPASITLPPGSDALFEIVKIDRPATAVAPPPAESLPAPLPELARQWISLQSIFRLLAEPGLTGAAPTLPGLLAPGLPNAPPMTPQAMSAGLMLFVAALKGGDFFNWLGHDNVRRLETGGHGELLRQAESDFSSIARQFSAPAPTQSWQALFFPLAMGGEVQQLRLFVKRDRKKDGEKREKKDEDTRFVVEMDLSQLGEMQMDGFVRRHERELDFDLVIRSHSPLEEAIQREIQAIYQATAELTGYRGQLTFQAVREFPVHPLEEIENPPIGDIFA